MGGREDRRKGGGGGRKGGREKGRKGGKKGRGWGEDEMKKTRDEKKKRAGDACVCVRTDSREGVGFGERDELRTTASFLPQLPQSQTMR